VDKPWAILFSFFNGYITVTALCGWLEDTSPQKQPKRTYFWELNALFTSEVLLISPSMHYLTSHTMQLNVLSGNRMTWKPFDMSSWHFCTASTTVISKFCQYDFTFLCWRHCCKYQTCSVPAV